jgi:hypothetical protein
MKTNIKTVFLSSTAIDLATHREKVYRAIEGLGYHCVRMEDFGARDTLSAEFCRQKIRECDLFVCLIGLCYGSTPSDSESSFTLQEYQAASEGGVPHFVFVSADNYFYPGYYHEPDIKWQKQQDFRRQLSTEALYDTFTDPQELATKIVQAISNWMREHPENLLPISAAISPRPYHNLPQPDYTTFVGRQKELDWLRQRLARVPWPSLLLTFIAKTTISLHRKSALKQLSGLLPKGKSSPSMDAKKLLSQASSFELWKISIPRLLRHWNAKILPVLLRPKSKIAWYSVP